MAGKRYRVCRCGHDEEAHRSPQIGDLTYCRLCECPRFEFSATLTIDAPKPKRKRRKKT